MVPERIVCLAAEVPEILDVLGVLDRVVGISAYTTRPSEALSIPRRICHHARSFNGHYCAYFPETRSVSCLRHFFDDVLSSPIAENHLLFQITDLT